MSCSRAMMFQRKQDFDNHVFPDLDSSFTFFVKKGIGFSTGIIYGTPVHLKHLVRYVTLYAILLHNM